MKADVVGLPRELPPGALGGRTVVVLDVLRATTSMTAALSAGVEEIRVFGDVESARKAAGAYGGAKVLCGEVGCLPPAGFDLGNSPGAFGAEHAGRVVFMSTTNGTRAIIAAREAKRVLVGALVNAEAVARAAERAAGDVTLLCAGTNGQVAMEDLIGAGAILAAMRGVELESDVARVAVRLFEGARGDLLGALAEAQGGRNVVAVGLEADVAFAARLNAVPVVGGVEEGVVVRRGDSR